MLHWFQNNGHQLCLQESHDNPSTNHFHEIKTENHIVNAAIGTTETVSKPRAERTSLSSESSLTETGESDSEDSIEETTPLISTTKHPRILFSEKSETTKERTKDIETRKIR